MKTYLACWLLLSIVMNLEEGFIIVERHLRQNTETNTHKLLMPLYDPSFELECLTNKIPVFYHYIKLLGNIICMSIVTR
jgi:hypothetical protein